MTAEAAYMDQDIYAENISSALAGLLDEEEREEMRHFLRGW